MCVRLKALAEKSPDRPYLIEATTGQTLSFGEVWDLGRRWATRLRSAGVGRGDMVVSVLDNHVDTWPFSVGVALVGAVEVPLNIQYKEPQFAYALSDVSPVLAVVEERFVPMLADLFSQELTWILNEHVAVIGEEKPMAEEDLILPAEHDLAWILYTSGTTGPSKGVMMSWGQIWRMSDGSFPPGLVLSDDVWYNPYPLCHVSGRTGYVKAIESECTQVVRAGFSSSSFWAEVDRYGVTGTLLMGATLAYLMALTPDPSDREHSLRFAMMAPVPPSLAEVKERFGISVTTVFNMTEISSPIVSEGYVDQYSASCGKVREGYLCRVVDGFDNEVPNGTVGELVVRADVPWALMLGYWAKPEATVAAWRNLWFHTGDAFYRDDEGNFYFVDRLKDCIRRRGENISSMEVEGIVSAHALVAEAAAVAIPSSYGEDDVKLVVVPQAGANLSPQDLADFLVDRLPKYAQPTYIEFVEGIEKTASEKYRKVALRDAHDPANCWVSPEPVRR
jgi:crotonobetaine/carnitine-CoA ligase